MSWKAQLKRVQRCEAWEILKLPRPFQSSLSSRPRTYFEQLPLAYNIEPNQETILPETEHICPLSATTTTTSNQPTNQPTKKQPLCFFVSNNHETILQHYSGAQHHHHQNFFFGRYVSSPLRASTRQCARGGSTSRSSTAGTTQKGACQSSQAACLVARAYLQLSPSFTTTTAITITITIISSGLGKGTIWPTISPGCRHQQAVQVQGMSVCLFFFSSPFLGLSLFLLHYPDSPGPCVRCSLRRRAHRLGQQVGRGKKGVHPLLSNVGG